MRRRANRNGLPAARTGLLAAGMAAAALAMRGPDTVFTGLAT